MYVTAVHLEGLRGAASWEATGLDRIVELPPGPLGIAVADALSTFAASLRAEALADALARLEICPEGTDPEIVAERRMPVQFRVGDPGAIAALVDLETTRQFTVFVDIEPDPPLYGRLRELAVREPRLVTALADEPTIRIKLGWLLSRDYSTVAVGITEAGVGDISFQAASAERPEWLDQLLRDLGARFTRVYARAPLEGLVERMLDASLSHDPDAREGFERAAEALATPPFGLGRLQLVRSGGRLHACFGPELLRARQFGPAAAEALRLVEAVYLDAPDVLVVESPGGSQVDPQAVRTWLAEATRGDDATLEQVWMVPGGAS